MLRVLILVSSLILLSQLAIAQDSLDVASKTSHDLELSNPLKDSVNHFKSIIPDSTFTSSDSLKQEAKNQLTEEVKKQVQKDSHELKEEYLPAELGLLNTQSTLDSTFIEKADQRAKEVVLDTLNNTKLSKYTNLTQLKLPRDSAGNISKDSIVMVAKEKAIDSAEGALKSTSEFKELEGLEANTSPLMEKQELASMQNLEADAAKAQMKQKMFEKGKDFLAEHMEEISQVQSEMTELKQKYSSVVDKEDLNSATHRNSLKGEPFLKRFVFGGNFNINSRDPFLIDLSPLIGYKLNKKCQLGLSSTFRQSFEEVKNGLSPEEPVFGYSFFANYIFYKQFFANLEAGRLSKVNRINEALEKKWEDQLLLGLGLNIKISQWLTMQSTISYNVLHHYTDELMPSAFVFKVGFKVSKP